MAADSSLSDLLLKHEGDKGWKTDLFVEPNDFLLCSLCHHICRDAVDLLCDEGEHDDVEIPLYCTDCLQSLLRSNGNKCPLTNHEKPSYDESKRARRKIMNMKVMCPNSKQYKQKVQQNANAELMDVVDTKEGVNDAAEHVQNNVQGCDFRGTLKQLVAEHITECVASQPMSQEMQSKLLQSLKHEVTALNKTVNEQTELIKAQNMRIEKVENSVKAQQAETEKLKQTKDELTKKIDTLQQMFSTLQQKLVEQSNAAQEEKQEQVTRSDGVAEYTDVFNKQWTLSSKMRKTNAFKIEIFKQGKYDEVYSSAKANTNLLTVNLRANNTKIRWRAKMVGEAMGSGLPFIGVVSNRCSNFEITAWHGLVDAYGICPCGYSIQGKGGHATQSGSPAFKSGEVIQVEFDTAKRTLSFSKPNKKSLYTINLPNDSNITGWYPAVSMKCSKTSFEIL